MSLLLYRLVCKEEFLKISDDFPLSWINKVKFFTDTYNFLTRVSDGKFNNSSFRSKYKYLIIYEVGSLDNFKRVSTNELMLYRHKEPLVNIKLISKREY